MFNSFVNRNNIQLDSRYCYNFNMLKIAILDDNEEAISELSSYLTTYKKENEIELQISTFNNGFNFLDSIKEGFQIVFLDIDMPGINGLDVARKLRTTDKNIIIVFVTNMASCAINGYEVEATDFLVKPIRKEQISFCMSKCLSKIVESPYKKLTIKTKEGYVSIKDNEIIYIEVNLHSLIYHTRSGIYEAYGSLKDLELILDESKFSRCNSCYLVNLDFVQKIDGDECVLPTEKLPISRSKKKKFIEKFLSNI